MTACGKEPPTNSAIRNRKDDPLMSAKNIEVLFSDSGRMEARLTSPLLNRYEGERPVLECPKGFKISIFDDDQQISSTITGDRGLRRDRDFVMEAWGNVVVRNEKSGEQLNTEHLVWDEKEHRIWADTRVKITRPDQVLYGTSMESNEAFTRYTIHDPTGEMAVKKDSL